MTAPLSDDRLAEIRADKDAMELTEVVELLAEVERLRAKLDTIRTTETDVAWLANMIRDVIDGISVGQATTPEAARQTIAEEVHSLIQAGLLTARISSQVIDLSIEYIRAAEAERDRLAEQVQRVRDLHPKRENPRHGCCAEPKVCKGHVPECRGRSHGLYPPSWPCADIRALDGEDPS